MSKTPPDAYWTSTPKEGIRDNGTPLIYSTTPDVCKTPIGSSTPPIPYSITSNPADDASYTGSVKFTKQKVMVLRSNTTCCTGDEPGSAKGVKSGTVTDICEPIDHSSTVRAEGSYIIRHGDKFHMNKKNTVGLVSWVEDTTAHGNQHIKVAQAGSATMTDAAPPRESAASWGARQAGKFVRRPNPLGAAIQGMSTAVEGIKRYKDLVDQGPPITDTFGNPTSSEKIKRQLMEQMGVSSDEELKELIKQAETADENKEKEEKEEGTATAASNVRVTAKKVFEVECFNKPDHLDDDEFKRQLDEQEDEINNTSADKLVERRQAIRDAGGTKGVRDHKAQQDAREKHLRDRMLELREQQGLSRSEAKQIAMKELKKLAATHTLDIIAGGDPSNISGMGNRSTNSSLGAQWKGRRSQSLEDEAKRMQKDGKGKEKMNVKLEKC